MKLFARNTGKKTRGQTMVEFALILPLLLTTMYGVMEFGRLLFIYVTTASASREAARYAAAVGISDNGVEYYNDCAGIRAAAQRVGILAGIQDSDVIIQYDSGPGISPYSTSCPTIIPGSPELGDRIVVTVTGHFEPIVPFERLLNITPISIREIESVTARTIIRNVTVGENFVISPPIDSGPPPTPYFLFETASSVAEEGDTVTVRVVTNRDEDGNSIPIEAGYGTVSVVVDVVDIREAKSGADFVQFEPITLYINEGENSAEFSVSIINDTLFEQHERIVLYISSVSNNNIGYPRLHVITINPDLTDVYPEVRFETAASEPVPEYSPEFPVNVRLGSSGAPAWVKFRFLPGELEPGVDFTFAPSDGLLVFGILDNAARTTSTLQQIRITPIDNLDPSGHRTVDIELYDPGQATLVEPDIHTITFIDNESCNITLSNVIKSGNDYLVDLINDVHPDTGDGVADVMTGIRLAYTRTGAPPALQSVIFKNNTIYSGSVVSPVTIPSETNPWILGADLSLPLGYFTPGGLVFHFSNQNVNSITSLSIDFEICGTVNWP